MLKLHNINEGQFKKKAHLANFKNFEYPTLNIQNIQHNLLVMSYLRVQLYVANVCQVV